ncbi:MAG: hypothetical protein UX30_C0001G0001, partial [Candidatus Saccharibacteria bacterium GW2011_GWA2_46_10]
WRYIISMKKQTDIAIKLTNVYRKFEAQIGKDLIARIRQSQ